MFPWLQELGQVSDDEMFRVFNMGIGLVMIVADYYADAIVRSLRTRGKVASWIIGEVVTGERTVVWA